VAKNLSQFDGNLATGRRLWVAALREMTPEKTLYPDANSTMRLTYVLFRITIPGMQSLINIIQPFRELLINISRVIMNLTCRKDLSNLIIRRSSEDMHPLRDTCLSVPYNQWYYRRQFGKSCNECQWWAYRTCLWRQLEAMSMDLAFEPEFTEDYCCWYQVCSVDNGCLCGSRTPG